MRIRLPVILEVLHEVRHERLHLVPVTEGEEGNESHQRLEHTCVGAHKGRVDPVQQHHQLVTVPGQLSELLQTQGEPSR